MKTWIVSLTALFVGMMNSPAQEASPAPAPDFPKQTMTVTVVDEYWQPVEGVNIHRSVWTNERFPPNSDLLTNPQGQVSIITPVATDILRLWARKSPYVPLFVDFEKKEMNGESLPSEFTFQLSRGTTIGGFVMNESGAPIAHAKVEVYLDDDQHVPPGVVTPDIWLAEGKGACQTDEHGFWSLDCAPPGDQQFGLWLSHPDFVSDLDWRGLKGKAGFTTQQLRTQNARLTMEKGVQIRGAIKDPDGKPVAKAMVVWGHRPYHNPRHQEILTDQNGAYHLPPMASAPTLITLVAEGYAPQLVTITPDKGEVTYKDFHLERGETTHFRFVDEEGNPLPRVSVNIAGWRNEETLFNWRHPNVPYSHIPDKADDKGGWNWDWAPGDKVDYFFEKLGYVSDLHQSYGPGEHEVVLLKKK